MDGLLVGWMDGWLVGRLVGRINPDDITGCHGCSWFDPTANQTFADQFVFTVWSQTADLQLEASSQISLSGGEGLRCEWTAGRRSQL